MCEDWTPEEYVKWDWDWDYYEGMRRVEDAAIRMLMSECPICRADCGEENIGYDEADPSVGIMYASFDNYCPDCNVEFRMVDDGEFEREVWESDV